MDSRNIDIVLVRMDKLGDLILSLPVDEHPFLKGFRVDWLITKGLGSVVEQTVPQRRFTEFKRGFSPLEFLRLVRWFRQRRPQTVILLHCPWWVSCAAWMAGIKERIGRQSQWHSYLFLNIPIRQKRSVSDRHESDYNFDLVEFGFEHLGVRRTSTLNEVKDAYLKLIPPNPLSTVSGRGLSPRKFRVVHPGMAGSALNWPQENFVELIKQLSLDLPVVITGTKADKKYLTAVAQVKDLKNVYWFVEQLRMGELLDLLSQARSVIAPSTGVLHLAASLGTPTIGIYSPRRVEHPRRWGPKGPFTKVLIPPAQVAENFTKEIMQQIEVSDVVRATHELEGHFDDTIVKSRI